MSDNIEGTLVTTHPKNGSDVTVSYNSNYQLINAVYTDNEEEIEMTDRIASDLQHDIDTFVVKSVSV